MESADVADSKSVDENRVGSSPTFPTIQAHTANDLQNQIVVGSIPTLQAKKFCD